VSPSRAFISARAIGDTQLTWPGAKSASLGADDRDRIFGFARGGVGDGRAEEYLVAPLLSSRVDHLGASRPLRREADALIDLAQAPLALDVVAVLGAVAVAGRPCHGLHDSRALDPQHSVMAARPPRASSYCQSLKKRLGRGGSADLRAVDEVDEAVAPALSRVLTEARGPTIERIRRIAGRLALRATP
jgi:hypothetical protein